MFVDYGIFNTKILHMENFQHKSFSNYGIVPKSFKVHFVKINKCKLNANRPWWTVHSSNRPVMLLRCRWRRWLPYIVCMCTSDRDYFISVSVTTNNHLLFLVVAGRVWWSGCHGSVVVVVAGRCEARSSGQGLFCGWYHWKFVTMTMLCHIVYLWSPDPGQTPLLPGMA